MKKIHILISLGAVMAAAAGCTKTTVRGDIQDNGEQVPVVLNAEIPSAEATVSKSPITASSRFTATVGGWVSRTGSADYTGTPSWTAVTSEIAGNADRQPVTLTEQPYYEPDDADKTYMKAWYPEGTPSGGSVSFENTDGSVDAMMSREIVGSRKDKDGKNLVFDHLTAQLIFDVVGGEGLDAGTTITSIKVLEAGLPTGFDLAAGTATFTPAADGGLTVPGIDGTQVIGSTAAQAGLPVMVEPLEDNTFTLEVTTSGNQDDPFVVPVTVDDTALQAGTAYTITLTFIQQGVDFTATVTEWKSGTGSTTII